MIIDLEKKWPQEPGLPANISIGFMPGAPPFKQVLVRNTAKNWERCNVQFNWGSPEKSDVRIAFTTDHSYSQYGTNAKAIGSQSPTMGLDSEDSNMLRHDVLHEFGHMLGAEHEHQSPHFPYKWNQALVESGVKERFGSRKAPIKDIVKENILRRFQPNQPGYSISQFDPKSIMMYSIEPHWLLLHDDFKLEPRPFELNYSLSMVDIQTMKKAYTEPSRCCVS